MTKEYSDFLAHYGVKGQKWGIRRYQNEDGTLIRPKGRQKAESDTWKKSDAKNLSDEELNRRNNRLQREFQYKQNLSNRHPVRKEAASIAKKVLLGSAIGIATAAMTKNYKKVLEIGSKYLGTAAGRKVLKTKVASLAAASVIRAESLRRLK